MHAYIYIYIISIYIYIYTYIYTQTYVGVQNCTPTDGLKVLQELSARGISQRGQCQCWLFCSGVVTGFWGILCGTYAELQM